jgi:hypothetical protein
MYDRIHDTPTHLRAQDSTGWYFLFFARQQEAAAKLKISVRSLRNLKQDAYFAAPTSLQSLFAG